MTRSCLFAYGLLMTDMRYHQSHLAGAYFSIKKATAAGRLFYLREADCPAMVAGDGRVSGELYKVDESIFPQLDYLFGVKEGSPEESEYVRRLIDVETVSGTSQQAHAYLMRAATLRRRFPDARVIEDGDWRSLFEDLDRKRREKEREKYPGL